MKKGAISVFVLLLLSISYVSSATTFPASNVSIKIDGTDRTLQYAVDNGLLMGTHAYAPADISNIVGQHDASQIWVKIASGEQTLLSALLTIDKLVSPGTTTSYSSYVLNPGHNAMEVMLSPGQTFQQAIDLGSFSACIPGTMQKCGTDTSCTTYPTLTCTPSGTWPVCNPTYAAFGTQSTCSADTACDGAGNCQGYSGTGCYNNNPNSCPFGSVTGSSSITYCNPSYSSGGRTYHYASTVLYDSGWLAWGTTFCTDGNCWLFRCRDDNPCGWYSGVCTCTGSSCYAHDDSWKMKPSSVS